MANTKYIALGGHLNHSALAGLDLHSDQQNHWREYFIISSDGYHGSIVGTVVQKQV
jgi:hypothetical protein